MFVFLFGNFMLGEYLKFFVCAYVSRLLSFDAHQRVLLIKNVKDFRKTRRKYRETLLWIELEKVNFS